MKKTLALVLTLSLLLLPFSTGIPIANAASNGTLQIAFNPNVKSITVTHSGTSNTYTSQSYVSVPVGVTVTWTATCADGYAVKGGNSGSFTMTSFYQLAPTAEKVTMYPLTITLNTNVTSISVTIDGTTTKYTSSAVVNVKQGASVSWTAAVATGYNLSSSGGSFTMTTASSISPTASIKTFTVTVTLNTGVDSIRINGTSYTSSQRLTLNYGTSVSWSATPKTGYTLSQASGSFTVTSARTIAPTATLKTFTVKFVVDGSVVKTVNINYGQTVSSFTPSVAGYNFVGWYSNSNLTESYNFSKGVTTDLYLYAKMTVKSFTVSIASYAPPNADAKFSWKLEWTSGKSLTGAVSDYVTMTVASDGMSVTLTFKKNFSAGEMVLTCYATADPTVKATCTVKCSS